MDATALAIIGPVIGIVGLILVTGVGAIIRLQYQILDRQSEHYAEFREFRSGTHERVNALESRQREEDRVSLSRALEQVAGVSYARRGR